MKLNMIPVPAFIRQMFPVRNTADVLSKMYEMTDQLKEVEQDNNAVAQARAEEAQALAERVRVIENEGYSHRQEARRAVLVRQNILRMIEG